MAILKPTLLLKKDTRLYLYIVLYIVLYIYNVVYHIWEICEVLHKPKILKHFYTHPFYKNHVYMIYIVFLESPISIFGCVVFFA